MNNSAANFRIGVWTMNRDDLTVFPFETEISLSEDLKNVIVNDEVVIKILEDTEVAFISKFPHLENEDYYYQSEMFQW